MFPSMLKIRSKGTEVAGTESTQTATSFSSGKSALSSQNFNSSWITAAVLDENRTYCSKKPAAHPLEYKLDTNYSGDIFWPQLEQQQ